MHRYLNLHALTTYSGVLLVRDANDRPKELPYGTALRTMLSPQTQRRAQRTHLREAASTGRGPLAGYGFGIRTREWALLAAQALTSRGWESAEAKALAKEALQALGLNFGTTERTQDLTKVLIFAPEDSGENLAAVLDSRQDELRPWLADITTARAARQDSKSKKKTAGEPATGDKTLLLALPKQVKKELLAALAPADAIDIALFGRCLTEIPESSEVDGAVQTMPAITVARAAVCDDFYSAADDAKLRRRATTPRPITSALDFIAPPATASPDVPDDRGSGMTGYQSLTSGTFYSHTVLDRVQLRTNLTRAGMAPEAAESAAQAAEAALIDAFCDAVPRAKQTTTAAPGTLPKLVLAFTDDRQHNYVACFEDALDETRAPASLQAARTLLDHHDLITRKRGIDGGRILTYDLAITRLLQERRDASQLKPTEVDTADQLAPAHPELAGQPA
ncbi:type I-E CRISPR-associated protein Cas7/Cse4/CasC [Streptomyces aurantiacus]|uniref:CRISPR-associated protein n=1 Tax=Streptomyces aurantiacus JA 4570 TaxID=1286094 RepID=S3ZD26_9ACTN|nr:type I-E CRISPR-associated protein Cas7/Cse4/CasC [Streptomyces aurantiacus]EPH41023.1 hypothetical protein STRAU_5901 [Streptomyces aurantiacus JA 4570]